MCRAVGHLTSITRWSVRESTLSSLDARRHFKAHDWLGGRWRPNAVEIVLELRDAAGIAQRTDLAQEHRRLERRLPGTSQPIDKAVLVR